jgi:hypothetical protein
MDVMAQPEPRSAAREAAASVSNLHFAPFAAVPHDHTARVTRQATRSFRRNACAVFERRLARCVRVLQHLSVDMDHDLIALGQRGGIDAVVQGGLGEQTHRVSLLLRHGRRFRGNFRRAHAPACVRAR